MAVLTDDKRFSSPSRHALYPGGFFWPSFHVEVSELTDMVNFDVLLAPAHFTRLCEESFDQFAACAVKHAWNLIMQHCFFLPPERNTPEVGYKWFLPLLFPFYRRF